jgi:predicted DNA-binding protein (UPF0251 family)
MAEFNSDFWEIPADSRFLESVPAERALWFETDTDRERRYAFEEFFQEVSPVVSALVDAELTRRQQEVIRLHFFLGKTQEDIAAILDLSQSTVSRHLFGTVRAGRKVGGAIPKLQKVIKNKEHPRVGAAFAALQNRLARAV